MDLVFEPGKAKVYADDRERNSETCVELGKMGVDLVFQRLPVSDFVVSDRTCLERKTASDFESSVIDGRLFLQAQELKENFASPLIGIVGSNFERINGNAIRGALIALAVEFRIPVFFFKDELDLASFIFVLAVREQKPDRHMKIQFAKKGSSIGQQQRLIVESLPMIGPKNALSLLEHFKTIEKLANASEKELREVKGIGKERAKQIRAVFAVSFD